MNLLFPIFNLFIIKLVNGVLNDASEKLAEFKVKIVDDGWKDVSELKYLFADIPQSEAMKLSVYQVAHSNYAMSGELVDDDEGIKNTGAHEGGSDMSDKGKKVLPNEGEEVEGDGKKRNSVLISMPSYKFRIPTHWAYSELELRITFKKSGQIMLRRFELGAVIEILGYRKYPMEVQISIQPKSLPIPKWEVKEYREKNRQFRANRANTITLLNHLEFVQLKKLFDKFNEAESRKRLVHANTEPERFEYAQIMRDFGWLYFYVQKYFIEIPAKFYDEKGIRTIEDHLNDNVSVQKAFEQYENELIKQQNEWVPHSNASPASPTRSDETQKPLDYKFLIVQNDNLVSKFRKKVDIIQDQIDSILRKEKTIPAANPAVQLGHPKSTGNLQNGTNEQQKQKYIAKSKNTHTNTANDDAAVGGNSGINSPRKKQKQAIIYDSENRTMYPEEEQDHISP